MMKTKLKAIGKQLGYVLLVLTILAIVFALGLVIGYVSLAMERILGPFSRQIPGRKSFRNFQVSNYLSKEELEIVNPRLFPNSVETRKPVWQTTQKETT